MASATDVINEKIILPILTFVNTKPVTALKNGMMFVMPLTIVGALFLLLGNLPIPAWTAWLKEPGFPSILAAVFNLSWTSLVPQLGEHFGDVVGEGGFGVEVLAAGDANGDVLQRA